MSNTQMQTNLKKKLGMIQKLSIPQNNPYVTETTMSSRSVRGGVSAVQSRLANQSVIGNGMLAQKIFGIDSQGKPDGCCSKAGICPNVNPRVGSTCNNACQITNNQNDVERSYLQNNNILLNYPGLMKI